MVRTRLPGSKPVDEEKIANTRSGIASVADLSGLLAEYKAVIPDGYKVTVAPAALRLNSILSGNRRVMYAQMFRYGFRFPVDSFIQEMCASFNFNPAQLSPNSFCCVYAFLGLCKYKGIAAPSLLLLRSLFQLYNNRGVIAISPRYNDESLNSFTWKLLNLESSIENWKEEFFVLEFPEAPPAWWRTGFNQDIKSGAWGHRVTLVEPERSWLVKLLQLDVSVHTRLLACGEDIRMCVRRKYRISSIPWCGTNADVVFWLCRNRPQPYSRER